MAAYQDKFKQISIFSTLLLLPVVSVLAVDKLDDERHDVLSVQDHVEPEPYPQKAEIAQAKDERSVNLGAVTVAGDAEARARSPGLVHKIDEATL